MRTAGWGTHTSLRSEEDSLNPVYEPIIRQTGKRYMLFYSLRDELHNLKLCCVNNMLPRLCCLKEGTFIYVTNWSSRNSSNIFLNELLIELFGV